MNKDYSLKRKKTFPLYYKNPIFFVSDTHFSHDNIALYCNRPWTKEVDGKIYGDSHRMNVALTENWNRTVPPNGIVFCLGDFGFPNDMIGMIKRLNGKIHFITGNHDKKALSEACRELGLGCTPRYNLTISDPNLPKGKVMIVMHHYPMISWEGSGRGSWHLFGHCHGNLNGFIEKCLPEAKMLDVGVDNIARMLNKGIEGYRPISYAEVFQYMMKKQGMAVDHHDE